MNFRKKTDSKDSNQKLEEQISGQISGHIEDNENYLKKFFSNTGDLIFRKFSAFDVSYCAVYLKTISDKSLLEEFIIKPLLADKGLSPLDLPVPALNAYYTWEDVKNNLINGNMILFKEGSQTAYTIDAAKFATRSVAEPSSEQSIIGTHEGFVESYEVNIGLIRKYLRTDQFVMKDLVIGDKIKKRVGIGYLGNQVDPEVVKKAEERIKNLKFEGAVITGQLKEQLQDQKRSPFPQVLNTERPVTVAEHLSTGAILVLIDGVSTIYLMPASFFAFYHAPDDAQSSFYIASFHQCLRLFSLLLTITLAPFYICVVAFDAEIIPVTLIANVKGSLQIIPFSPLIEALIMQITLELLNEATIRLPKSVSPTIGVVGALVIGTAIVQANLVSNTMLIVLALTGISSFVTPNQEMAVVIRLFIYPLLFLSNMFGLVGLAFGLTFIVFHLCSLSSFGQPYLAPLVPFKFSKKIKKIGAKVFKTKEG